LEAADMHSVHCKYGIPFFSTLHTANYLKTDSKAMVTQILDTLIENAVNHSKIVATEIIDDIGKFSFQVRQVTKVLSVTECFRFVSLYCSFQNIVNDFCCNNLTMIYSIFNQRI
jgi:hypothetical protein